jgi:hypothetical protein
MKRLKQPESAAKRLCRESLLIMSIRHVRLHCQAATILQRHTSYSAWVMALMPVNMPAEAHCQEDRGINARKIPSNENVRKTKIS